MDILTTAKNKHNHTDGLNKDEVSIRVEKGLVNILPDNYTKTTKEIVKSNILTVFNILNFVLAVVIIAMGEFKNAIFIGVAISNTVIKIYQELKFKRTIENLSILAQSKVTVIRDGKKVTINQEDLVIDDTFIIAEGDQIPTDGLIIKTEAIEIDESLLTGEPDHIYKQVNDSVMSGSFVTSGSAYVKVSAVGTDNYATKLSIEAKAEKNNKSKLMQNLDNIIRVLTVIIVPIGILLFYTSYTKGSGFSISVLSASAAMIGMIPQGLILLTSVTFAVGATNLAKHKTLVKTLPSIETLARADVLCLDKTGTITDGKLKVEEVIPLSTYNSSDIKVFLAEVMSALDDNNETAKAIKDYVVNSSQYSPVSKTPFSSSRKWSGASFIDKGSYILGSPSFIFENISSDNETLINNYTNQGLRVLALGHSLESITDNQIPNNLNMIGLIIFSDNLRENSKQTFKRFVDEGVELKIISGDSPVTVSNIAKQAEIPNSENYIDMSKIEKYNDYQKLAAEYTVFGRVSPQQKRELVKGLQASDKTVCMTGDGVNDVLALKQADCAIAMAGGSDAATSVSDFVLLDKNFGSMVEALKEGRRVINNIENVSSLYLIGTIYSTLLALIFIFIPLAFPYSPLQMNPINSLTVGIPSFFLALERNYKKPEGVFLTNVLENAVPAAITVVVNILIIQLAGLAFDLTYLETSTMAVLLTGIVGFLLLFKVSKPLNWKKNTMLVILTSAFILVFTYFREFFDLASLFTRNVFFYLPLIFFSYHSFFYISSFVVFIKSKYNKFKEKRALKKAN